MPKNAAAVSEHIRSEIVHALLRDRAATLSCVFGKLAGYCAELACADDATREELADALDELREAPFAVAEELDDAEF